MHNWEFNCNSAIHYPTGHISLVIVVIPEWNWDQHDWYSEIFTQKWICYFVVVLLFENSSKKILCSVPKLLCMMSSKRAEWKVASVKERHSFAVFMQELFPMFVSDGTTGNESCLPYSIHSKRLYLRSSINYHERCWWISKI